MADVHGLIEGDVNGMDTGEFTGFEVALRKPGIAWLRFNTPERLNGMTTAIKRDLIEAVTQAHIP